MSWIEIEKRVLKKGEGGGGSRMKLTKEQRTFSYKKELHKYFPFKNILTPMILTSCIKEDEKMKACNTTSDRGTAEGCPMRMMAIHMYRKEPLGLEIKMT